MSPVDAPPGPVVLFDGVCNFCNFWVQFIIRRDPDGAFRFASLQSDVGRTLALEHGAPEELTQPGSMRTLMVVDEGRLFTHSDAVLRIARRMPWPWRWMWPLRIVPRWVRDPLYALVSTNRYRLFGRRDSCMVPTPDVRRRFLR